MPEFRQDIVTGDWVIMAQDRAHRPYDHGGSSSVCPFCPENEEHTPPAILTVGDAAGWSVRIVANKYPALTPEGEAIEGRVGLHATLAGVGFHEVVVESPEHNSGLTTYTVEHLAKVIAAWAERQPARQDLNPLRYCGIMAAGWRRANILTLIMAMPFVPDRVRAELERAHSYTSSHGTCLCCDMIRDELAAGTRVVTADADFVALAPFAPKMPFETWILPMRHQASFGQLDSDTATSLARVVGIVAKALDAVAGEPPHNLVLRTAPTPAAADDWARSRDSYHWRLEIVPRLSTPAGFEMGTGVFVNVSTPEDAARCMRTAVRGV